MESTTEHRGTCLCGAVRISAKTKNDNISACHCTMCRKWGGGPLFAADCNDVIFEGMEHVSIFGSSEWAERGFCQKCGTHLFYRLKQGGHNELSVGLFDGDPWKLTEQVFIDEKPSFYSFAQKTKELTGEEAFALYSQEREVVLEIAVLDVKPGQEQDFEAAFAKAQTIISSIKGYQSHQLQRCIESSSRYVLLVNWATLEDHTVGFRESEQYQIWRKLLHHFYDPFPVVEHFELVNFRSSNHGH